MSDDVIPLNEIGKIETVKIYNQAYVDKQQKRIAELEKENAELKLKLEALEGQTPWKDIKDKSELIKENAELKEQLNKNPCVCNTEWHCNDCLALLTKAKEIIKDLCGMVRELNNPNVQLTDVDYSLSEAEQFLKE